MKFRQQMAGTKRAAEARGKQEVIVRRPTDLRKHTRVNTTQRRLNCVYCLWRGEDGGEDGGGGAHPATDHMMWDHRGASLPLHAFSVRLMA